jgi:hypothetical protein
MKVKNKRGDATTTSIMLEAMRTKGYFKQYDKNEISDKKLKMKKEHISLVPGRRSARRAAKAQLNLVSNQCPNAAITAAWTTDETNAAPVSGCGTAVGSARRATGEGTSATVGCGR